jgi:hypothetical protein
VVTAGVHNKRLVGTRMTRDVPDFVFRLAEDSERVSLAVRRKSPDPVLCIVRAGDSPSSPANRIFVGFYWANCQRHQIDCALNFRVTIPDFGNNCRNQRITRHLYTRYSAENGPAS